MSSLVPGPRCGLPSASVGSGERMTAAARLQQAAGVELLAKGGSFGALHKDGTLRARRAYPEPYEALH